MKNKKDLTVMLKEAAIMFAITLVAGLMLGFVYQITKEPIRIQQEKKIQEACQAVFADASEFVVTGLVPTYELQEEFAQKGVTVGTVFEAKGNNGKTLGYVFEVVSSEGYGGNIGLYMGVKNDGTLNGISILEIAETPGLGMEAEPVLVPQFVNKKVTEFTITKTGSQSESELDAISGATITTKAVTNAVNAGLKFFAAQLQEGGGNNE
ncbi:MAG: RnfABCDGE type electron transport complex subunit G [Lachnospiraceae bacterium]|nr:RnfABCDGE type electron transport complex subunit G [Lachnospiraceae bacterium]